MTHVPTGERQCVRRLPGGRASLRCALAVIAATTMATTSVMGASPQPESKIQTETEVDTAWLAEINARQPHHAVRSLAVLQERIAQGEEAALALLRPLIEDIADEIKAFPPEVWQSPRNRQALIKFALSGGDPRPLQVVMSRRLFTPSELPLAQAALAYAEGNSSVALRLLDGIDVYTLPPSLAGHVALVKAIVIAKGDLSRVLRLADDARLLSPGTLVEETALRLAIEAAISLDDHAKFETMVLRYFRRFPRSPYLASMIRPVATEIAARGYAERLEGVKWVYGAARYLDPGRLVQFYSALADAGLGAAKLETAISAARMTQRYARPGTPEQAWAFAYEGAALVVSSSPREG